MWITLETVTSNFNFNLLICNKFFLFYKIFQIKNITQFIDSLKINVTYENPEKGGSIFWP